MKKKKSKIGEIIAITIISLICIAMFLLILFAATLPSILEYIYYDPATYIPDSGEIVTYSAGYGTEGTADSYDPPPSLFKCVMSVAANIIGPGITFMGLIGSLSDK